MTLVKHDYFPYHEGSQATVSEKFFFFTARPEISPVGVYARLETRADARVGVPNFMIF